MKRPLDRKSCRFLDNADFSLDIHQKASKSELLLVDSREAKRDTSVHHFWIEDCIEFLEMNGEGGDFELPTSFGVQMNQARSILVSWIDL